jgi:hypothetical protein
MKILNTGPLTNRPYWVKHNSLMQGAFLSTYVMEEEPHCKAYTEHHFSGYLIGGLSYNQTGLAPGGCASGHPRSFAWGLADGQGSIFLTGRDY